MSNNYRTNNYIRKIDTFHIIYDIFAYMDLILAKSFLNVAEIGSISEAANRLNITQSALSRRIQQYEDQLGAKLIARSRKGIELTEIGKLAIHECEKIINIHEKLVESISLQQGLENGIVRIGGGATAVSHILPSTIAIFQKKYPKILFQLKEAGSAEVAKDVNNGHIELGIVTLPLNEKDLVIEHTLIDDIVLICRKGHPLTKYKEISVNDLENFSFVGFDAETALRNIIDNEARKAGLEIKIVMELRSIPSILQMVITTGSLAFVSRLAIKENNLIKEVPITNLKIKRKLALISKKNSNLSMPSQAFLDKLKKFLIN